MTRPLEGRSAIVTGGGAGIGRDLCLAFAAAGAKVGVAVRRLETGEETAALIAAEGGTAMPVLMDVTDAAAVTRGVGAVVDRFGGLAVMIHNANDPASALPEPAHDVTPESWNRQGSVTLHGAYATARAAHPHLKRSGHGRFVVMTSDFGYHGAAMNLVYAAQKASLRAFIKSLGREWGGDAITVNAISPAAATPPTVTFFAQYPDFHAAYLRKFPLGRIGEPRRDIGEAAVALCSDALGYMTGQTLFLDGGLYPSA